MDLLWNTSAIQGTLYKATVEYFVIKMDNGDQLPPANKVIHFIKIIQMPITFITRTFYVFS